MLKSQTDSAVSIASGNYFTFQEKADRIVESIKDRMVAGRLTASTAESITGGLVGASLVSVPGASLFYKGGVVAYSNESKMKVLGVKAETLSVHGAVSMETAVEMAKGARALFDADIALSCTGIAGPSGQTEHKPVGLVYIAAVTSGKADARERRYSGNRTHIRLAVADDMLSLLLEAASARDV